MPAARTSPGSLSALSVGLILLAQSALLFAVIAAYRTGGWDDGAITLAFSRTFATAGRVALTPLSETVEGFSSVSWFLINAIPPLFGAGFAAAITISQLLCAAALLGTTVVLADLCRMLDLGAKPSAFVLLTFACFAPGLSETANGMEMGLLAAAGVLIARCLIAPTLQPLLLASAVVVFTATRFEAAFYVVFFAAPLLLQRRCAVFLLIGSAAALTFLVIAAMRWEMLGTWLPNTVLAKANEPYSPHGAGLFVWSRVLALVELPTLLAAPFLVIRIALGRDFWPALGKAVRPAVVLAGPVVGALAFSIVTGVNWGFTGRMGFFAIPLALLLLGLALSRGFEGRSSPVQGWIAGSATLAATSAALLVAFLQMGGLTTRENTPVAVRAEAIEVDAVRAALGEPSFVYLTPDIGGAGLCCDKLGIVDSALLANRRLALKGYGAFEDVLREERPHAIRTHGLWSDVTRIGQSAFFRDNYRAITLGGIAFHLRTDIFDRFTARPESRLAR